MPAATEADLYLTEGDDQDWQIYTEPDPVSENPLGQSSRNTSRSPETTVRIYLINLMFDGLPPTISFLLLFSIEHLMLEHAGSMAIYVFTSQ